MDDLSRRSLRELLTLARERLGRGAAELKTRAELIAALRQAEAGVRSAGGVTSDHGAMEGRGSSPEDGDVRDRGVHAGAPPDGGSAESVPAGGAAGATAASDGASSFGAWPGDGGQAFGGAPSRSESAAPDRGARAGGSSSSAGSSGGQPFGAAAPARVPLTSNAESSGTSFAVEAPGNASAHGEAPTPSRSGGPPVPGGVSEAASTSSSQRQPLTADDVPTVVTRDFFIAHR